MNHPRRRHDRRTRTPRGVAGALILPAWRLPVRAMGLAILIALAPESRPAAGDSRFAPPPPPPPPINRDSDAAKTPPANEVASPASATQAAPPAAGEDGEDGAAAPTGQQHLVKPGQDIAAVLEAAVPGDEVILWPGRYSGVSIRGLAGRADAPITLRGLRADDPPVIEGGAWGLRLRGVAHLRISHLTIARSRIHGIEIGPDSDGNPSHDIQLQGIRVEEIGERPGRHGIALIRTHDVTIRDLTISGWTGSAIEIIGSHEITIERAELRGAGRGELLGIRMRAGTTRTAVRETRIIEAGLCAIALGGRSLEEDFPVDATADHRGRRWEVRGPMIEDVTILGGEIAVTFLGATQASLMHLTILDPRRSAIRIARPHESTVFAALDASTISRTIIAWREAASPRLVELGPGSDDSGLWLEENLWWRATSPFPAETDFPGHESFPQLLDVDPVIGADLKPRAAAAADFGDRTPPAGLPAEAAAAVPDAGG